MDIEIQHIIAESNRSNRHDSNPSSRSVYDVTTVQFPSIYSGRPIPVR